MNVLDYHDQVDVRALVVLGRPSELVVAEEEVVLEPICLRHVP